IYSLGVIIYQMLTGVLPFNATTIHGLVLLQMTAPPPPLRALRTDTPAAGEDLINRMLSKDPDQRPSRAQDIPGLFDRAWRGQVNGVSANDQPPLLDAPGWKAASGSTETEETTEQYLNIKSFDTSLETNHGPALEMQEEPNVIPPRRRLRTVVALLVLACLIVSIVLSGVLFGPLSGPLSGWTWSGSIWPGREIDSLAVLPLKSASADSNAEYLSAGLTEGLITSLSRLPKLRVIARSSVFRYKNQALDPKTAGSQL